MQHITAIGFDLFDTLVTIRHLGRTETMGRLLGSLKSSGLTVQARPLCHSIAPPPERFSAAAHHAGQETHNQLLDQRGVTRDGIQRRA